MDYNSIFEKLKESFPKIKILQNEKLAKYTTVNIGGPADIFIKTKNDEEFLEILKFLNNEIINFSEHSRNTKSIGVNLKKSLNVFFGAQPQHEKHWCEHQQKIFKDLNIIIIGNGSNVLISDSGIRGIVIKNNSQNIEILKNNQVKISAGVQLPYAINFLTEKNLLGLEEFAYIPSTIGGAISGNIHGIENNFSKYLESVEVFDLKTSTIYSPQPKDLNWDYDFSNFQQNPHLIILSAVLNLKPGDKTEAKNKIKEIIIKKSLNQPMNSLGSVFKNPSLKDCQKNWSEQKSAGWIIDHELNWKGKTIGQAQISPLHGNFIINLGNCTAADYYTLATSIQSEVYHRFHLKLEFEIKFLGKFN
jgi:UDP-N-acetylmuramate dehydrogenase